MVSRIAQRIHTAFVSVARVLAGLRLRVAVSPVGAVVVRLAFWFGDQNAVALRCEFVAVVFWADAAAAFVDDESALKSTDAVTRLVDLESAMDLADDALFVDV